jgi:5-methyltetrahydropteroyltriglutamate--homocysteine methyltransferase
MTDVAAGLTGPFPRSEALVEVTRRVDRGLEPPDAADRLYQAEMERIARREGELGFAFVTGGFLPWQDLFRPWIEQTENLDAGPLSRWFQTNTFYRPPRVLGPLLRRPKGILDTLPSLEPEATGRPRGWVAPGPWTFARLCEAPGGERPEELSRRWAGRLALEAPALRAGGVGSLLLLEPSLVTDPPPPKAMAGLQRAYRPLAPVLTGPYDGIWTFFGDAVPVLPLLSRLPGRLLGVDLTETEPDRVRSFPKGRTLGLGVLDPRTSLPEELPEIVLTVRRLLRRLSPARALLGPAASLDLLAGEAADKKLTVLSRAAEVLNAPGTTKDRPKPRGRGPVARGRR